MNRKKFWIICYIMGKIMGKGRESLEKYLGDDFM